MSLLRQTQNLAEFIPVWTGAHANADEDLLVSVRIPDKQIGTLPAVGVRRICACGRRILAEGQGVCATCRAPSRYTVGVAVRRLCGRCGLRCCRGGRSMCWKCSKQGQ